ncbi:MAG: hypothetical protein K2X32_06735 [Phycisphaerales bacterium]|jgi:hypothetical protein|nr:hypothetical protein [Phycisphaerales bacterium]
MSKLPSLVEAEMSAPERSSPSRASASQPRGDLLKIGVAAIAILAAGVLAYINIFSGVDPQAASRSRGMIDSETREFYPGIGIEAGQVMPFVNPRTGRKTLFPAEFCYWTKDGKVQVPGTAVLLNEYIAKPEPTLCPDCGRRVVFNNPPPPAALMSPAMEAARGK